MHPVLDLDAVKRGKLCPKRPYVLRWFGVPDRFIPATCGAWGCPVCGPRQLARRKRVLLFAAARYNYLAFWTLTSAPSDWNGRREAMARVRRRLSRRGQPCEFMWAVEPNARGLHIHAVASSRLHATVVQAAWDHGYVHSTPIREGSVRACVGYTIKAAFRDLPEHLALNNARPVHYSRRFLDGPFRSVEDEMRRVGALPPLRRADYVERFIAS